MEVRVWGAETCSKILYEVKISVENVVTVMLTPSIHFFIYIYNI